MTLVVHYWADLQSVHGLRRYGNITRTRNVSDQHRPHRLRYAAIPVHTCPLTQV